MLFPERLHISRSLRKTLKRGHYRVTADQAFEAVMRACAAPRDGASGTWITDEMLAAYIRLHHLGVAHSVEVWQEDERRPLRSRPRPGIFRRIDVQPGG